MEHWSYTKEVKDAARVVRRQFDRSEVESQMAEAGENLDENQNNRGNG